MGMTNRRTVLAGATALILAGVGAYTVKSILPENLAMAAFFSVDGQAIRGTDPVAYFTQGAPAAGTAEFMHEWGGTIWYFASAENRDLFMQTPDAYAPQYGGFCAWAVAEKGTLYSTQPKNWAIVDGKLYLNYNDQIQDRWNQDIKGFIKRGDAKWAEMLQTAS